MNSETQAKDLLATAKKLLEKQRVGSIWANPTVEKVYKILCDLEAIENNKIKND